PRRGLPGTVAAAGPAADAGQRDRRPLHPTATGGTVGGGCGPEPPGAQRRGPGTGKTRGPVCGGVLGTAARASCGSERCGAGRRGTCSGRGDVVERLRAPAARVGLRGAVAVGPRGALAAGGGWRGRRGPGAVAG